MPPSTSPSPAGREGDRGQQRGDERHEERAADADLDVREAQGQDHEVEPQRLGGPDEHGRDTRWATGSDGRPRTGLPRTGRTGPRSGGAPAAGRGSGDRSCGPRTGRPPAPRPRRGPMAKMIRTSSDMLVAEAPEAGGQAQDHDRDEVEDALDEDGAEGLAERHARVDAQQVAAVDITQLGRHHAVDQPADEDHLGGVLDRERVAHAPDEHRPAPATDGEAHVVDGQRPPAATTGWRSGSGPAAGPGGSPAVRPPAAAAPRWAARWTMIVRGLRRRREMGTAPSSTCSLTPG